VWYFPPWPQLIRCGFPSIVRYHTAWTETEDLAHSFDPDAESSTQHTERTSETDADDASDQSSSAPSDFDEESDDSTPGHDLDMDLGLDDFDDIDFLSVGHSKSVSYPSIHFGNESDASTNGANSPVQSRHSTRVSSPVVTLVPKQTRTLYIQVGL
jgi:translation initiation factor 2-alpha kinase 4